MLSSLTFRTQWGNTTSDKAYNGPGEVVATLNAIMETYTYRNRRDEQSANFFKGVEVILDGAFLAAGPLGPKGTVSSLIASFGMEGAQHQANSATTELMTYGADQTTKWLETKLSDLMRSDANILNNLQGMSDN